MSGYKALIPIVSWILLNATTGVLLTVHLKHRLYFLPAIIIPAMLSFRTIQYLSFPPGLSELWGTITLIGFLHFSSLLYIKKWTLSTTQQTNKASKMNGTWLNGKPWTQMYKTATSPRFVGIPYDNVVIFQQSTGSHIKSTATHTSFSAKRVVWPLIQVGLHLFFNGFATTKLLGNITINDFAPAKAVFVRRLLHSNILRAADVALFRDLFLRVWFTVNSIWTPILLIDSIHAMLAILFIFVLRVDTPDDWPDLFGSPFEAFTLRNFWTRFWHRVHLSGYTDYAELLINVLPRYLTRNAIIKRALLTFLLFFTSGLVHQFTTWQLNSNCRDYADIQFFCMNAVAVILESTFLQLVSSSGFSQNGQHRGARRRRALRLLRIAVVRFAGYIWVMNFFFWVIPKVYYSRVHCMIGQQQVPLRKNVA